MSHWPYRATMTITGGLPAYYCSVVAGSLPDGLELNSFTGEIAGVPRAAGAFRITLQIQDNPSAGGITVPLRLEIAAP